MEAIKVSTCMRLAFLAAMKRAIKANPVRVLHDPTDLEQDVYTALHRGVGQVKRHKWWSVQRGRA